MIKAIIFDMDGVISDTERIYGEISEAYLKEHGIIMSARETSLRYAGLTFPLMFADLFAKHNISYSPEDATREVMKRSLKAFETDVQPMHGALALIDALSRKNFKLGVASGAKLYLIDMILSRLDLKNKFHTLTSSEEVARGKPYPYIFLLTAQRLGVQPEECVVIEDGLHGMIGAKKAGMKVVALDTHGDLEQTHTDLYTDLIVQSLEELNAEAISRL